MKEVFSMAKSKDEGLAPGPTETTMLENGSKTYLFKANLPRMEMFTKEAL